MIHLTITVGQALDLQRLGSAEQVGQLVFGYVDQFAVVDVVHQGLQVVKWNIFEEDYSLFVTIVR